MNRQVNTSVQRPLLDEAMLQGMAEMQTSLGMALLMRLIIVVLTYCRIVVWMYVNKPSKTSINNQLNN